MIPVSRAPEPESFDRRVRQPGQSFLRRERIQQGDPAPERLRWNDSWRRSIRMLHIAYADTCAYLGSYLNPKVVDGRREGSVEHFVRKADDAWKAYEWSNFLLADGRVNTGRDHSLDPITCPFDLDFYPFELILESGMIDVADGLTEEQEEKAYRLLDALHLDDEVYDRERAEYYASYTDGTLSDAAIAQYAPFIWHEIQRQGLVLQRHDLAANEN